MINQVEIGQRIRDIRIAYGLSGVELARYLGIDQSYLCKIESGKHLIGLPLLADISKLFSVDLNWFVFGDYSFAAEDYATLPVFSFNGDSPVIKTSLDVFNERIGKKRGVPDAR